MEIGSLIAFTTVTETIYSWPGLGKLLIDSINSVDRPVIVAYLILTTVLFVFINFVVDFCIQSSTRESKSGDALWVK